MPRFSLSLGLSQRELDFVDVSNEYDIPVYVDPYAIEIQTDLWAIEASNCIKTFFKEVIDRLITGDMDSAADLMSHLQEPQETFLGVSSGIPAGRGVGHGQSKQIIRSMLNSKAFKTGLLRDFTELTLYVDYIDKDKISDLTTNLIRHLLINYTAQQCAIYGVPLKYYSGPPLWHAVAKEWRSAAVQIPYIEESPTILVPKYIVRRKLSINSQDFYNRQITDFLVSEHISANTSLVKTVKGQPKVYKGDARQRDPHSKEMIAGFVLAHPEVLKVYKDIVSQDQSLIVFNDDEPSLGAVCQSLASALKMIVPGGKEADRYHRLIIGTLTSLFYPALLSPRKEWEINDGRKRIDIVFTNAADSGFFAQRRVDKNNNANMIIVECKNYSSDIANPEFDQLIGRFDFNRGKLGIIACRSIDDKAKALARCKDAAVRNQGYIIVLTDDDFLQMLALKASLKEDELQGFLFSKYRYIIS